MEAYVDKLNVEPDPLPKGGTANGLFSVRIKGGEASQTATLHLIIENNNVAKFSNGKQSFAKEITIIPGQLKQYITDTITYDGNGYMIQFSAHLTGNNTTPDKDSDATPIAQ